MTLKELIKYMRVSILDDTGGTGVVSEDISEDDLDVIQLRWTNEELTIFINEAINQVYRRIYPIQKVEPLFNITTVAGTAAYAMDQRILRILGIHSTQQNKPIQQADYLEVWNCNPELLTKSATPELYFPDYDNATLTLAPVPIAVDTLQLFVHRLPLSPLSWSANTASPELRSEWQIPMLNYAAFLAYQKDEANALDPQRAQTFLNMFEKEFLQTSAYSDTRKRRNSNRGVSYGGIPQIGLDSIRRGRNPYGRNS